MKHHVIASTGMIKDVGKCSTSAFLHSHGYHAIEPEERKFALTAGIAIHDGLFDWIQGKDAGECMDKISGIYKPYSDKYMELDSAYHIDNIELIMSRWFEKNQLKDMPFSYVNAEHPIRAKLGDNEVTTIPDVTVADKVDGALMTLETKTTGKKLNAIYAMTKRADPQFRQHIYVSQANGFNVKGVILNAIRINKIPQRVSKKCRVCKIRQDQCWVNHVEFTRIPLVYSPSEMLDWMKSTNILMDRYKGIVYDDWKAKMKSMEELHMVKQEGIAADRCTFCGYNEFCNSSGRSNFTLLYRDDNAREGIIRSGVVGE